MNRYIEIYNIKNDSERIKLVQEASISPFSDAGFQTENGLVFGSKEWFEAIEKGTIKKNILRGVISRVYMSGHNDFAEFEIENNQGKSQWERKGIDSMYKVGREIEIVYVEQKYKVPSKILGNVSRFVIEIIMLAA